MILLLQAGTLPSAVAFLTFVLYVFIYTPLKTRTTLNTSVGAIPGALPPLIGWAAAAGRLGPEAWSLFLIVFLWQFPHFLAIAWIYREDYRRAGFQMLTVHDARGRRTGCQAFSYALVLVPAGVLPAIDRTGRPGLFGRGTPARVVLPDGRRAVLARINRCPGPPFALFVVSVPAGDPHFAAGEPAAVLTSRPVAACGSLVLDRRVDYTMASETHSSTAHRPSAAGGHAPVPAHHAPVSPGKVAMWLFLATEVMFFTGLIGTYIVLRAGSSHNGYSNLYSPAHSLVGLEDSHGILLNSAGENHDAVEHILVSEADLSKEDAEKLIEESHHSKALINGLKPERAASLLAELKSAGARVEDLKAENRQVAAALRRADQPPCHQSHRDQYVHPDLLVAHDGAGLIRHPGRERSSRARCFCWPRS